MVMNLAINQADWNRLLAAHKNWVDSLKPRGAVGDLYLYIAQQSRDAAQERTHKDTEALSYSHRVAFTTYGLGGMPESEVYVSPIRNPKTGLMTTEYAALEQARGGEHDFYGMVIEKDLKGIVEDGLGIWEMRFNRV